MLFKKNNIRQVKNQGCYWLLVISMLILGSFSFFSYAQVITENKEYNDNKTLVKDDFEWQFLLDLSFAYKPTIIAGIEQDELLHYFTPGVLVDISYKGFFLQSNPRRSNIIREGIEFGYQVIVEDNWQLDLIIAKGYMQGYDYETLIEYDNDELLAGLRRRESTFGSAIRYSQYLQDALFTIDVFYGGSGYDVNNNYVEGIIIDSFYSYLLPYKNWDIYLGAGLTYFSQDIINYYIGVDNSEVLATRPEHTAKASFRGQAEVYALYPLSASWSFHTGITQSVFSNNVKESPLVDTNLETQVMLGVLYVF
jgi:outer membrane protein